MGHSLSARVYTEFICKDGGGLSNITKPAVTILVLPVVLISELVVDLATVFSRLPSWRSFLVWPSAAVGWPAAGLSLITSLWLTESTGTLCTVICGSVLFLCSLSWWVASGRELVFVARCPGPDALLGAKPGNREDKSRCLYPYTILCQRKLRTRYILETTKSKTPPLPATSDNFFTRLGT